MPDDLATNGAITTPRLDLTPLTPDDADEMVEVLAGDELYAFIGGSPPTLDELRAQYERQAVGHSADGTETWRNWIIRTRPDGRAVGFVQATITADGRQAEIAWVVGLAWQRRGYATEAATALVGWLDAQGVEIITANVHPDHVASESVARRIGLLPTDQLGRRRADLAARSSAGRLNGPRPLDAHVTFGVRCAPRTSMDGTLVIADVASSLEAVYRADADRLWRALYAYAADADLASEAVAEAYAQALRRGSAIHDPAAWTWRAAFRIAAGVLKARRTSNVRPLPEAGSRWAGAGPGRPLRRPRPAGGPAPAARGPAGGGHPLLLRRPARARDRRPPGHEPARRAGQPLARPSAPPAAPG